MGDATASRLLPDRQFQPDTPSLGPIQLIVHESHSEAMHP